MMDCGLKIKKAWNNHALNKIQQLNILKQKPCFINNSYSP